MAVTATLLVKGSSTTDQAAYTTGAWTTNPTADKVLLAAVMSSKGSTPDTPSLSGSSITWTLITTKDFDTTSTPTKRLSLFRARPSAPGTAGVTITHATTHTACAWAVVELDGVDTSGTNGSGAILQNATNAANAAPGLTVTLGAFTGTDTATLGVFGSSGSDGINAGTGFTKITGTTHTNPGGSFAVTFLDGQDTTVDCTKGGTTDRDFGGIAVELGVRITVSLAGGGFAIRTAESFGKPKFTVKTPTLTAIPSAERFGAPTIKTGQIFPIGIPSAEFFGIPRLAGSPATLTSRITRIASPTAVIKI